MRERGVGVPGDPAGVQTEGEIESDFYVWCSEQGLVVESYECEVVHDAPFVYYVRSREGFRVVVDEVAGYVEGVNGVCVIEVISVLIQRCQECIVPPGGWLSIEQNRVSLCWSYTNLVRVMLLDVSAINSNHSHGMRIELDKRGSKCCHANNIDFVGLAWGELKSDILRVVHQESVWERREKDCV